MSETTQQQVLDVVGEKWVVIYTKDNEKMMGMCNHHQALPGLISMIRSDGGKNIIIEDQTIFFVDNNDE
jgi:hypothetical protein